MTVSGHNDPMLVLWSGELWVGLGCGSPLGIPATSVCDVFAQVIFRVGQGPSSLCPENHCLRKYEATTDLQNPPLLMLHFIELRKTGAVGL